jgi:predicted enzyme related to lactoylglutathione lyase
MDRHEKIDYVEFSSAELNQTKTFFSSVFGWKFTDYGPDYCDSPDGGIMTGFFKGEAHSTQETGGALITFYSRDLEATQAKIEAAGGILLKPIFPFPGGRRFQFLEPGGNECAVWSDQGLG